VIFIVQIIIDAVSLGCLYALAALAVGLTFGVMRLVNFAYGEFVTIGAYSLIVPSSAAVATRFIGGWPGPLMVAGVVSVVIVLSLLTERIAFRPLRGAEPATLMVASFTVSYFLQNLVLFVYGGRPKAVDIGSSLNMQLSIFHLRIALVDVVTIGTAIVLLLALTGFLRFTRYGIEVRAASKDFQMARLLGVRADAVIAVAFAISGALAATVALLVTVKSGILDYRMGVSLALVAFVATVVGGMGSLPGCVLGGFFIGFISVIFQTALPPEIRATRDAFVFGFVILLLVWRPEGILRVRATKERI
jgi:branched-chain amino acid transport system permease protein